MGAHGACDRVDFVKKLGKDVVEQFPVYNHNAFSNLTDLGKTSRGTPVQVNSEVMALRSEDWVGVRSASSCDLASGEVPR